MAADRANRMARILNEDCSSALLNGTDARATLIADLSNVAVTLWLFLQQCFFEWHTIFCSIPQALH